MVDIAVGIAIVIFFALGLWEGLAKTLAGVAAVFAALFIATNAVEFMSRGAARAVETSNAQTAVIFFIVWLGSFVLLDFLLSLLFKKAIKVQVLGPLDKIGGALAGVFTGLLVCGIALQLAMGFPIPDSTKNKLAASDLFGFSTAVYRWFVPQVEKSVPAVQDFMRRCPLKTTAKKIEPEKITTPLQKYQQISRDQEDKLLKLLEEQKLISPTQPQQSGDLLKK
jgi:uncharacterized membrane protein required for colicin V production